MAPRRKTLEGIGTNVASFLVSAKAGRTPRELEGDYEELFHRPIPYTEIGVSGILDVLAHLHAQDKVRPSHGGRWVAFKVQGAEKLQDMVQQTRATKKTGPMAPQSQGQPAKRGGASRGVGRGGHRGGRGAGQRPTYFPTHHPPPLGSIPQPAPLGGVFLPPQPGPSQPTAARAPASLASAPSTSSAARSQDSGLGSSIATSSAGPASKASGSKAASNPFARCHHCGSSEHDPGQCPGRLCSNCWSRGTGHGPMGCPKSCCLCSDSGHKGKECPQRCTTCPHGERNHRAENCPKAALASTSASSGSRTSGGAQTKRDWVPESAVPSQRPVQRPRSGSRPPAHGPSQALRPPLASVGWVPQSGSVRPPSLSEPVADEPRKKRRGKRGAAKREKLYAEAEARVEAERMRMAREDEARGSCSLCSDEGHEGIQCPQRCLACPRGERSHRVEHCAKSPFPSTTSGVCGAVPASKPSQKPRSPSRPPVRTAAKAQGLLPPTCQVTWVLPYEAVPPLFEGLSAKEYKKKLQDKAEAKVEELKKKKAEREEQTKMEKGETEEAKAELMSGECGLKVSEDMERLSAYVVSLKDGHPDQGPSERVAQSSSKPLAVKARLLGQWCVGCERSVDPSTHSALSCPVCVLCRAHSSAKPSHCGQACPERFASCSAACQESFARPRHDAACVPRHLCPCCGSDEHSFGCPHRWCLLCDEAPARHDALRCPSLCPFCGAEDPDHLGRDCPRRCDAFPRGAQHDERCLREDSSHWETLPPQLKGDASGQPPRLRPGPATASKKKCVRCGGSGHDQAQCPNVECSHCKKKGDGHGPSSCPMSCNVCGLEGHKGKNCPRKAVKAAASEASSLGSVCSACGQRGHSGGPTCPNLACRLCGASGSGHGALGCPKACCFCLSPHHKGRFCPEEPALCDSTAKPNHTSRCLDTHLHPRAFAKTRKDPTAVSAAAKPRAKGRGRAASSSSSGASSPLPGGHLSSSPLPGGAQLPGAAPPPSLPSRSEVDFLVQKVVWGAGADGLTVKELDAAYEALTGRDLNADAQAVGYAGDMPVLKMMGAEGPIKLFKGRRLVLRDPEGFHRLVEQRSGPGQSQQLAVPEPAAPDLSFEDVKYRLQLALMLLEEDGLYLPVNKIAWGLEVPSNDAWEKEVLNRLYQEKDDRSLVTLFYFREPQRRGEPFCLALKPLEELLRELENHLLLHSRPSGGVVTGAELRRWWLMDPRIPDGQEKEQIFTSELLDPAKEWLCRMEFRLFPTADEWGEDYEVRLGLGGTWPIAIQAMPTTPGPIPVTATCVHHGGEFFVRLQETEGRLRSLGDQLGKYMERMEDWELLKPSSPEQWAVGELVALRARRDGRCYEESGRPMRLSPGEAVWWRGRITRRRSHQKSDPTGAVYVELLDRGSVTTAPPTALRRLPWYFQQMPTQAIRCHWARLVPDTGPSGALNPPWSRDSKATLRESILPPHRFVLRPTVETMPFQLRLHWSGRYTADGAGIFVEDVERLERGRPEPVSVAEELKVAGFAKDRDAIPPPAAEPRPQSSQEGPPEDPSPKAPPAPSQGPKPSQPSVPGPSEAAGPSTAPAASAPSAAAPSGSGSGAAGEEAGEEEVSVAVEDFEAMLCEELADVLEDVADDTNLEEILFGKDT